MGEVNVAVIAPVLGRDLSFVTDVDPRVRVFDANFAAPGHRAGPGGETAPGPGLLAGILAQAEVLLVGYPVPEGLAAMSPRLVWAHHTQAGVSNLAGTDLWGSQVTLTSSRGAVAATAIAEYALAAAAHFARGLHEAARQKAAGQFTREGYQLLTLGGATMGVIGLGGIGREVARLSRAAGMRVIGTRRSVTAPLPDADGADLVLPAGRILEVAADSDFLVVCSQLTAETRGFINAAVFAAMKPGAVLINVARGEEVDEDALVEAVIAGRIRGAVLDVYAGELAGRPPRPELTGLPQILLTPHISGGGEANVAGPLRQLFAGNLRRYLDGQPLLNVVDRSRGYLQGARGLGGGLRRQCRQFLVKELAGRPEHGGCGGRCGAWVRSCAERSERTRYVPVYLAATPMLIRADSTMKLAEHTDRDLVGRLDRAAAARQR